MAAAAEMAAWAAARAAGAWVEARAAAAADGAGSKGVNIAAICEQVMEKSE